MSNINWELFGSTDLYVIENAYEEEALYEEALLLEAGMVIDKKRLNDETYVRELIRDINSGKDAKYNWGNILTLILLTAVPRTLAMIPFCTLLNVVLHKFVTGLTKEERQAKSKERIVKDLDKMIRKCELSLSSLSDKEDKKAMQKQIDKLKHNRELLLK